MGALVTTPALHINAQDENAGEVEAGMTAAAAVRADFMAETFDFSRPCSPISLLGEVYDIDG